MTWTRPPMPVTLNGVEFTVETASDEFGRSLIEHAYPDRDGADLQDTGAEPQRVNLQGFIKGPTWLEDLELMKLTLSLSQIHTLTHPQWGTLQGRTKRLGIDHREDEHDMARIRLEFVVGTVQVWAFGVTSTIATAAAAVNTAASAVTAAAAALE